MNLLRTLLPAILLLFTLTACGDATDDAMPMDEGEMAEYHDDMPQQGMDADDTPGAMMDGQAAMPHMRDGVQVVEVEAGPDGYVPGRIVLEAGVPARIIFTRTSESACLEQVQVPDFGIEATDLPMNEPVTVEFTPDETGEFQFVCGMNMQHGTMVVRS